MKGHLIKNKNVERINMHIAQLINVYVVTELPCRHPQSLLQFHSNSGTIAQNNEKRIKKNKNVDMKGKNKNCPFLLDSLIQRALVLADKHDLPESFKEVLVDFLQKYFEGKR